MDPAIRLVELTKRFGASLAVRGVTLDIHHGEFLTLLGPSGCGKTTTLRMIAGFVSPDSGSILLHGNDVTPLPPNRRNIGMVYQQYALFPHLTVFENVAFGLRLRRLHVTEIRRRVEIVLSLVRLEGLAGRFPRMLSGGQQQRVALARALVIEPHVLLLDEPLSNLDAKLRRDMQLELRKLQRELGITTVYVTHDQNEALTMSDRIAVMNHGHIEQVDTPISLYHRPMTVFVASFVGQANLLRVTNAVKNGERVDVAIEGELRLSVPMKNVVDPANLALVTIRPEAIALHQAPAPNSTEAEVIDVVFGGPTLMYRLRLPGGVTLLVEHPNSILRVPFSPKARVWVEIPADAAVLLSGQ